MCAACSHASPTPAAASTDYRGFHVVVPSELKEAAAKDHLDVVKFTDDALDRIQGRLQTKPTTIEFFVGPQVIPELGITGYTRPRDGVVAVTVDIHSHVPLRTIMSDYLGPSLAHELHHSKRILLGPGYGATLGGAVVTEGMAIAFQRSVYPSDDPPFARALSASQEVDLWRRMKPLMDQVDYGPTHLRWFFGSGDVPRWTAYTIGYHLVKSYLAHHKDTTPASLALANAYAILAGSGYDGHQPSA